MLGNHSGCRAKGQTTRMIFQAFKVGCPIRRSMDQSSFAAPHGFSQRITSFIACACQGIHQMPLRHLIVLIANAHHLADIPKGCGGQGYLLQPSQSNNAINVFDRSALLELRRAARLQPVLRPASRDWIRYRAVRQR